MGGAVAMGLHKRIPRSDLISGRVPVQSAADAYQQAGELQKMVMDAPEDAEAWAALARDYEMTGMVDRAKEAHATALSLYLKQRNAAGAAGAYSALNSYGIVPQLTPDQQFSLVRALDDAGKAGDAFGLFRAVASHHPDQQTAETALVRAAEIARTTLDDRQLAADCYRQLLERFPYSTWRVLAQDRLREMNVPEKTPLKRELHPPTTEPPPADSDLRKL
jgi:TolA-binding protein